jgi:hypothetical protein
MFLHKDLGFSPSARIFHSLEAEELRHPKTSPEFQNAFSPEISLRH